MSDIPRPLKKKKKTHCLCGNLLPSGGESQEISPLMWYVARYSCSNKCHNESILGIGAFARDRGPIGGGWMPIVLECHEKLSKLDPDYSITQIKEKFGGLRYYFETSKDTTPRIRLTSLERKAMSWAVYDVRQYIKAVKSNNFEGLKQSFEFRINKETGELKEHIQKDFDNLLNLYKRSEQKMDQIVVEAEEKCSKTCEICGDPGKLENSQWYVVTLCERHTKMRVEGLAVWQVEESYREEKTTRTQNNDDK